MSNTPFGDLGSAENDLCRADRDTQLDVMRDWFYEHYEDPAESCPHETADGGYLYLWGGPYDAEEVLREQFEGIVPEKVIEELVGELLGRSAVWSAVPTPEAYDEYIVDLAVTTGEQFTTCQTRLLEAQELADLEVPLDLKQTLLQMIFVQVITLFETFLSDTFIHKVFSDKKLLRKLLERDSTLREQKTTFLKTFFDKQLLRELIDKESTFQQQKIAFSSILAESEEIQEMTKGYLKAISWHNLKKVEPLYRDVLGVALPDSGKINTAIVIRHDCVHRDGKAKGGEPVVITTGMVSELITEVRSFVRAIRSQM